MDCSTKGIEYFDRSQDMLEKVRGQLTGMTMAPGMPLMPLHDTAHARVIEKNKQQENGSAGPYDAGDEEEPLTFATSNLCIVERFSKPESEVLIHHLTSNKHVTVRLESSIEIKSQLLHPLN